MIYKERLGLWLEDVENGELDVQHVEVVGYSHQEIIEYMLDDLKIRFYKAGLKNGIAFMQAIEEAKTIYTEAHYGRE